MQWPRGCITWSKSAQATLGGLLEGSWEKMNEKEGSDWGMQLIYTLKAAVGLYTHPNLGTPNPGCR